MFIEGALAALSQNTTVQADIDYARGCLQDALAIHRSANMTLDINQPARIEFPDEVIAKALALVSEHVQQGRADVWYSIAADVDLHVLVDEDGLQAVLYPVINGATVVDRCLPLMHIMLAQD